MKKNIKHQMKDSPRYPHGQWKDHYIDAEPSSHDSQMKKKGDKNNIYAIYCLQIKKYCASVEIQGGSQPETSFALADVPSDAPEGVK